MADADDDWGDFAGDDNSAAPALYSKGSDILYQIRDGTWVPGKVISVDISIVPPSYCVQVQGNLRETEEWRLRDPFSVPLPTASSPALEPATEEYKFQNGMNRHTTSALDDFAFKRLSSSQEIDKEEEDFGDFSAALEPPPLPPPPPPSVPSFHSSPKSRTSASVSSTPPRSPRTGGGSIEDSFRKFLSVAAPNVAHVLEEQDALQTNTHTVDSNFEQMECPEGVYIEEESKQKTVYSHSTSWEDDFGDFADAPADNIEKLKEEKKAVFLPQSRARTEPAAAETEISLSPFFRNLGPISSSSASHSTLHTNGNHVGTGARASNAVQEYGVAWTLMLTIAAEKFEQGHLFWTNCVSSTSLSSTFSLNTGFPTPGTNERKHDATMLDNSNTKKVEKRIISIQNELLKLPRAQHYFAALGRIYYIASLVRLAAEMQGLLHFVQELEIAWTRCCTAWSSTPTATTAAAADGSRTESISGTTTSNGGSHDSTSSSSSTTTSKALGWVAIEAAKKLGLEFIQTEIESVEAVAAMLPTLNLDDFPRMLAWSEGLDSMLLLPLSVITDFSSAEEGNSTKNREESKKLMCEWPEGSGRQCLSVVANFWLGCVSSVPPELE